VVVNKDVACFVNARQLLVLQEWGTFYDVESCVAPLRDPRTPRGARCDVEIVDGSHHRQGGDVVDADAAHRRVKGVETVRTSPSPDWDTSPTQGIVLDRGFVAVESRAGFSWWEAWGPAGA